MMWLVQMIVIPRKTSFDWCFQDLFFVAVYQVVSNNVVQSLLRACKTGLFDQVQKVVTDIIDEGYPVSQILSQVYAFKIELCTLIYTTYIQGMNFKSVTYRNL